jgi:DNA-binding transcriptional ArsR family regulator
LLQLSAHFVVSEDKMSLADLFSALADPTRLRVLELLHDKPRPVHELAGAFDISRPAISRHLRVLKEAGLVREVKQGRENLYSFQRDELKAGIAWLETHQRKARKGRKAVVAEASAAIEVPVIVAEPIVLPEPAPVVPEPAAEPIVLAEPKAPAKRRTAKPKVAAEPVAPPPPKQAPQLSFFDL